MIQIPLGLSKFGLKAIATLKKIPLTVWLCLGGVVAFWGWGHYQFNKGQKDIQIKWDAQIIKDQKLIAELKRRQGEITERVVIQYVDKVRVVREKGKEIHRLVPVYIPADTPALPPGFRVLHDAAASGTIPGTPEGTNAAPVPVKVATETIIDNYTSCKEIEQTLVSLQEWVTEQRQAYLDQCRPGERLCSADK